MPAFSFLSFPNEIRFLIYPYLLDEFFENDQRARHGWIKGSESSRGGDHGRFDFPFHVSDFLCQNLRPWSEQPLYEDYPRGCLTILPRTWHLGVTDTPESFSYDPVMRCKDGDGGVQLQYIVWQHKTKLMQLPSLALTSKLLLHEIGNALFKDKLHIHLGLLSTVRQDQINDWGKDVVERPALHRWLRSGLTVQPFVQSLKSLRLSADAQLTVRHTYLVDRDGKAVKSIHNLSRQNLPLFTIAIGPGRNDTRLAITTPFELVEAQANKVENILRKVCQHVKGNFHGGHIMETVDAMMGSNTHWLFYTSAREGVDENGQGGFNIDEDALKPGHVIAAFEAVPNHVQSSI